MTKKLQTILLFLFILLLPTQLGKHFFFDFSYLSGIRVDYLAPTLYLTDVLAIILFVLYIPQIAREIFRKRFIVVCILLCLNILFSSSLPISVYTSARYLELYFIFIIFKNSRLSRKSMLIAFSFGALVETLLVVIQLVTKHSVQGLFYFFGERFFSLSTPGIAKISFHGVEMLRPYGTFSHPNSLAGFYLLLFAFFLTYEKLKKIRYLRLGLLAVCSLLILFSFSKIAIIGLFLISTYSILRNRKEIGCTFCWISRITIAAVISLIFLFGKSDPLSLQKRVFLVQNAFITIIKYPLFGTGVGSYLVTQVNMPAPYFNFLNQPVHNVFLLFFSETGIVLGLFFLLIFTPYIISALRRNPYIFFVLLLTGLADHYWITLHQNMLVAAVVLGSLERKL